MSEEPDLAGLAIEKIARVGSLLFAIAFAAAFVVVVVVSTTGIWEVTRTRQVLSAAGFGAVAVLALRRYQRPFKWTSMDDDAA